MKGLKAIRPLEALAPILAIVLLWPMLSRYERPVEDRDFGSLGGGSADFASNYLGSLALVRGFDPYLNGRPEFKDPWNREIEIDGVAVSQYYLPGHYVGLSPLAWIYGEDWEGASRTYFRLHLAFLILLAGMVAWGACVPGTPESAGRGWFLWAAALMLLGLQVGVRLGLERGQSDVIQSVLFWGGVLAAARERFALAAFLIVAGTSFKGYGVLLLLGLGLSCLGRPGFRPFVLGALAAALPLLAWTWPYVLTSLRVVAHKAGDFHYHWANNSFMHVGWAISPAAAGPVRYLLAFVTTAAAVLCWKAYRSARGPTGPESTARLVVAATVSIAAMVGISAGSAAYTLVMVLPGLFWIAELVRRSDGPLAAQREGLFAAAMFLIMLRTPFRQFSPAAYGLVLLTLWCLLGVRANAPDPVKFLYAGPSPGGRSAP